MLNMPADSPELSDKLSSYKQWLWPTSQVKRLKGNYFAFKECYCDLRWLLQLKYMATI